MRSVSTQACRIRCTLTDLLWCPPNLPASLTKLTSRPSRPLSWRNRGLLIVLVESLSPRFALFLVMALMLEQPVLLVAAPGSDELLMHAGECRLIPGR